MADEHKGFKQQKWPSRLLNVTRHGAILWATYDFLLVFSCHYVFLLHRFQDTITQFPKFKEIT